MLLLNILKYILFINICILCDHGEFEENLSRARQIKTRCTRRYSPGVCVSHLDVVWTFVFHMQNCTERLGCVNYYRGNRYKTYDICMRNCDWFIDMYRLMLEVGDTDITTASLRKGPARKKPESLENMSVYMMNYEDGEKETHSIVYSDVFNDDDIFPLDVDHVDGEIRSQYELLHP